MYMAITAVVDEEKSPRGVRGFMLNTGDFGQWRVQGKVGGYTKYVVPFLAYLLFDS
jgi:hypothetical protein